MSSPKRHHYLPDFYLQSFCCNGFIWVYDRELREYRKQTPLNTAVKSNYYAFREENGVRNNQIEAILARVEGATKPVLSTIAAGKLPTPEDRYTLALFVSFLKVRVPNFQHQVNEQTARRVKRDARMSFGASEAQAEAFLKRFQAATGTDPELSAKELFDLYVVTITT